MKIKKLIRIMTPLGTLKEHDLNAKRLRKVFGKTSVALD
jgi:hypothetical protein